MKLYVSVIFFSLATSSTAFSQTDSAEYFYQKGLKEKETGRRLESWKNFDKAYRYNPNSKPIVTELANALLALRRYGQAREKFQQLEKMGETNPALYKQLLTLSYNTKQFDDALAYAEKLTQADPAEKVNYYIGRIHYDRDNYGLALKHLQAAEKEEPANAEVPYLIARSYADMMNFKLSVPYFLKAIELDSAKSHWVYELGLICYGMHADKEALKYILLAAEKGYPRDNDYMENLGIAYLNVGNVEEGLKIMKEMLAKRPSDMNILNMVAETYYYTGKYKDAIDYWDRVLSYDKTNAQALYMIGMSYQKKGEKEKGMALCDKAIEMDPSLSNYKHKKMQVGL
jgi:tetratricopeptide (TPR) repeat protein